MNNYVLIVARSKNGGRYVMAAKMGPYAELQSILNAVNSLYNYVGVRVNVYMVSEEEAKADERFNQEHEREEMNKYFAWVAEHGRKEM